MALTSNDETDLLLPLFGAMHENPRFSTFLSRIQRRTGAEYVSLIVRRGAGSDGPVEEFFAGMDLRQLARDSHGDAPYDLDRVHYDALRPGRVYAIGELIDHDPVARAARARQTAMLGIGDERVVRLAAGPGHSAWLMLARKSRCPGSDAALLSNLAPYVTSALETLVTLERETLQNHINAMSLSRTRTGWMAFDRDGGLAAIAPATARFWQRQGGGAAVPGERLPGLEPATQRTLAQTAMAMANSADHPATALILRETPRIEALLAPLASEGEALPAHAPVLAALFSLDTPRSPEGGARLAALHGLPAREAELALALADGLSLAEAASDMGLTLETARNYSKRLYAKLGVRGQAQLVRLVYESSAVMA